MVKFNSAVFLFLMVFVSVFFLYLIGVSPSVYGGDSGDIILSAWFGSIAHAPGYPLNSLLGWVFTHLPYAASIAFKANVMAAMLLSITVGVFYLIVEKLTKNRLVALSSCFALAFSSLYWLYAHIIEVFQLNVLLVAISVYFLFFWRGQVIRRKNGYKHFYLSIFFFGLAFFHHQTAILIGPAFLYLILKTNRKVFRDAKNLLLVVTVFCLGFLPYVYLPIASVNGAPTNWSDATSIQGLLKLVLRSDYGTFVASGSLLGSSLSSRLSSMANFFLFLKADFGIPSLILIVLGVISFYKHKKEEFTFVILAIFFTGPFFLFYSSFPFFNDFYKGLWERFLLLSYFFVAILLSFGFKFLVDLFNKLLSMSGGKNVAVYSFIAMPFLFLIPLNLFSSNKYKADLSSFYLGDWLANDVLLSAEPNSIIFLQGDTVTFNTEYVYYTTSGYKSLKLIRAGSIGDPYYRAQLMKRYPEIKYPSDFTSLEKNGEHFGKGLIELNKNFYPIYFRGAGIDIHGYRWSSSGLLQKLVRDDVYSATRFIELNDTLFRSYKYSNFGQHFSYIQFMTDHLKESYFGALISVASEAINNKQYDEALRFIDLAMVLFPSSKDALGMKGNVAFFKGECDEAIGYYKKVLDIDKKEWKALDSISNVYLSCKKDENNAKQYLDKAKELKNYLEGGTL